MKPWKMGPIKINLKFSGGASGKVAATCPNGPSLNLRSERPYPEKNIMFWSIKVLWWFGITALDCITLYRVWYPMIGYRRVTPVV